MLSVVVRVRLMPTKVRPIFIPTRDAWITQIQNNFTHGENQTQILSLNKLFSHM